jgi:hypothetical protein
VEVGLKGVFVVVRVVGDVRVVCAVIESEVLVVIVRGWEVVAAEFVVVAEVVVLTDVVTAFAVGYVGGVRARKAEKKFEKNGLRLGAIVGVWCVTET